MTDLFEIKLRIYSLFRAGKWSQCQVERKRRQERKMNGILYTIEVQEEALLVIYFRWKQNQKSIRQTIPLEYCSSSEWVTV